MSVQQSSEMVRVDGVRKVFGDGPKALEALRSVSFAVETGQFVSILGPSGCGKSTLLNMVAGLDHPSTGTVRIQNELVVVPRREIGIVFQDAVLLPWKTALENVLFPIRIMKLPLADYEPRARELLDAVGLAAFMDHRPSQLSGGMRQRVAICRGLIHDPEVLLMDEPFSALDTITRDQMNVMLMQIWERFKRTALFVTHSIREAAYLSDRVIVMGRRPSQIICDEVIRFPRPRPLSIMDSAEFNALCAKLRAKIDEAHGFDSGELH
ncbi:MAG TPA: ABC transporter ATP-binding protein [Pseudolabrys sp.]|jgi:NitT/TauT family transport system ATP-binding protein|nr:ABC transporter ATP-binding protein [Pseudolabrys sp.]